MANKFELSVAKLQKVATSFDNESVISKHDILKIISLQKFTQSKSLIRYYDLLQFLCAYPSNPKIEKLAWKEIDRMTEYCKKSKNLDGDFFLNSGLPFSEILMGFSHDCLKWMMIHSHLKVCLDRYENPKFELNDVLRFTLPSLEAGMTSAGLENDELITKLGVKPIDSLQFLLNQFDKFNDQPFVKDFLFEGIDIYVGIKPTHKLFSKAFNRLPVQETFYHAELLKKFDHLTLLNSPLPEPKKLNESELNHAINVAKNSMALALRETDPTTYMDESSFRLYELERGISIAIYGMVPARQLPLESYVGYTLFKNGFQAAYGGSWVFGDRALFGINISESLRGGESGFIMCQLLRVYRQVFGINYFEVEPYQYGADNPDGIKSGAFWFYYRYGFRPLDKTLAKLAVHEAEKIRSKKGYRSSIKVLEKFTDSNIALNLGEKVPLLVAEVSRQVSNMIAIRYKGNRQIAVTDCLRKFKEKTGYAVPDDMNERQVQEEMALWIESLNILDNEKLDISLKMIRYKPVDLFKYQELLIEFIN